MDRTNKNILIIIAGILMIYILLSFLTPKSLDWTPTYNTKDKIPMGMYVFNREIDSFFNTFVERYKLPISDYFYEGIFEDSVLYDYSLLYIHQEMKWNKEEAEKICRFVQEGNSAFISSVDMPEYIKNELKISCLSLPFQPMMMQYSDTITVSIADTCLTEASITHFKGISGSYFTAYDTLHTQVLGTVQMNKESSVNFIKVRYGNGLFLLHLEPAVFTNYFLLQNKNFTYAESALSYIPPYQDIIWSLHNQTSKVISDSPFRFILSQPSLKWAWYLMLAGTFLFIIFNIRRSQRAIRSINKPMNTSVEFVRTIGNMYFQDGDIRNIMNKKIIYLMERIRSDFHFTTDKTDDKFIHLLHLRSGKDLKIIEKLIFLVNKHRDTDYTCTMSDLSRLNTAIENFYK